MRAPAVLCFSVSVVLLGACGRPVGDVETVKAAPQPPDVQSAEQTPAAGWPRTERTLGQPRLSSLIAAPTEASETAELPTPPAATFSRYNGRLPGEAAVPSDVPLETASRIPRRLSGQRDVPSRDVVDVGLNRAVTPPRPAQQAPRPTEVAAISRAPAPTPRPVAATPTPIQRPVAETVAAVPPVAVTPPAPQPVEPVLPPQPSIAVLRVPGLAEPTATGQDTPPTGLPVLRSVEQAVPLGTLPASLGVANIEAAEAALPKADQLEQSVADDSGTLSWSQAEALIRAGEVETAADIGEFEVLLTLCSGRGVLTIQPTPTSLGELEMPKVVCGKSATLTSQ